MAKKKTNLKPASIDWFCRRCWRHGVVTVGVGSFAMRSPGDFAYDDHKASATFVGALCPPDAITWQVRPPVEKKRGRDLPPPPERTAQ